VFAALVMQRAKRMRLIILSSVACPGKPYSSTLYHTRRDFRKKKKKKEVGHDLCALIFSKTFV
jgi:hypothetical protein